MISKKDLESLKEEYSLENQIDNILREAGVLRENRGEMRNEISAIDSIKKNIEFSIEGKFDLYNRLSLEKKNMFYSREYNLLYVNQEIHNVKEQQIKQRGFSICKTKYDLDYFLENFTANIYNDYSNEINLHLKESIVEDLYPELKYIKKNLENKNLLEQFKIIDEYFSVKELDYAFNLLYKKYHVYKSSENKNSKGIKLLRSHIFNRINELKIIYLNKMYNEILDGDFDKLDKLSGDKINLLINNNQDNLILIKWATSRNVFDVPSSKNDLYLNMDKFLSNDFQKNKERLTKIMKLLSNRSIFDRHSYEELEKIFGKPMNLFFNNWLNKSYHTLNMENLKSKNSLDTTIYYYPKEELWKAEQLRYFDSKKPLSFKFKETKNDISIIINQKELQFLIGQTQQSAEGNIMRLLSFVGDKDFGKQYLSDVEISLKINKNKIYEGISKEMYLDILIESFSANTKLVNAKDMVNKMQREMILKKKLEKVVLNNNHKRTKI